MKKLILASVAALTLVACGDNDSKKEETTKVENSEKLVVDKNLTNVELTLPASFFEDQTKEDIEEAAKKKGVKEVKVNEDGSVYYKMSKATHKEIMSEMKKAVEEGMDSLVNDDDFASFKDISANKDFTKFKVTVNQEAYEGSFDGFGLFGLAIGAAYYDTFSGNHKDNLNIEMTLIDDATGETIETINFPEDFNDNEEASEE